MKQLKVKQLTAILLATVILFASCSSTTMIQSIPSGAKVYIDGQPVGTTPYRHSDTKIVGSLTNVELQMEGFEPYYASFSRSEQADVGAIVGGIFFLVPFLWTMGYNPTHTYELYPATSAGQVTLATPIQPANQGNQGKSTADRLSELKNLLDQGLITNEDYEIQKKRILEEH